MNSMTVEAAFGFIGALLLLIVIYYAKKTLEHLKEHQDVSLANFFLKEKGEKAFIFLSITAFVYALAMMVTGLDFLIGNAILLISSRSLIIGVIGMLLYFQRELFVITKKNSEED